MLSLDAEDIDLLGYGPGWDAYADKAFDNYQVRKKNSSDDWMWRYRHEPKFRERCKAHMRRYASSPKGRTTAREYARRPEVLAKRKAYMALPEVVERRKAYQAAYRAARRKPRPPAPVLTPEEKKAKRRAQALASDYRRMAADIEGHRAKRRAMYHKKKGKS